MEVKEQPAIHFGLNVEGEQVASVLASYWNDGIYIFRLEVDEKSRGLGYAKRLFEAVKKRFPDLNLYLHALPYTVAPGPGTNRLEKFYQKQGFEKQENGLMKKPGRIDAELAKAQQEQFKKGASPSLATKKPPSPGRQEKKVEAFASSGRLQSPRRDFEQPGTKVTDSKLMKVNSKPKNKGLAETDLNLSRVAAIVEFIGGQELRGCEIMKGLPFIKHAPALYSLLDLAKRQGRIVQLGNKKWKVAK